MIRFKRHFYFAVLVSVLLLALVLIAGKNSDAEQKPASAPAVTRVEVQPIKTLLDQPCPVSLVFRGEITVSGAATVRYVWIDSRGRTWPEHRRRLSLSGTSVVTHRWNLGKPGKTVDEWVELKVLAPESRSSSKMAIHFTCGK